MINAGLQICAASEEECRSSGRVYVQGKCQIEIDLSVELFNLGTYFFFSNSYVLLRNQ